MTPATGVAFHLGLYLRVSHLVIARTASDLALLVRTHPLLAALILVRFAEKATGSLVFGSATFMMGHVIAPAGATRA
jgi:hypothetical protein